MKYKIIIYEPGKIEGNFYDYECGWETMYFMYTPSIIEVNSEELGHKLYEVLKHGFRDNQYVRIEYNTDTSAHHPIKDDDIVRTCINNEVQDLGDKELLR